MFAHFLDHRGEAADVGLVQRRVHFVQQTERRGIQLEDREHQRHRGHRLLAAGQQRDVGHALAGRTGHDRDAGVEQILAGEFEIGVTAAEQARIEFLHAGVDAVEGVLEAAAGFAVDLADRFFQRFQRGAEVQILRVEIFLALRGFGVFLDGGQIDRLQPPQLGVEIGDDLFPGARIGVVGERVDDLVQHETAGDHRFGQLSGLERQGLLVEPALRDALAPRQRLFVALVAGLFERPQFAVDAFQRRTRGGEMTLGEHALFQRNLTFALQRDHRLVAVGQLRSEFAEARIELAALAAHAVQRLCERDDLRPLRFKIQCQRMRGVARFARADTCGVACFGQRATFGFQHLAGAFEFAHPRDGVFQSRTRLARLLDADVDGFDELADIEIDLLDAVARGLQPSMLALQLAGEFGDIAMREIQRALRILALLLGGEHLVAQAGDGAVEFGLALLQGFDSGAQFVDFAFAQQRALLGGAGAHHAHPAGADALALAGDDRFAVAQPGQHLPRIDQGFGDVQLRQHAPDRQRALHFRGQRSRRERIAAAVGRHQRDAAFAEFAQRIDQRFRRFDQHAFDQLTQRAFDRVFPAGFDLQHFADARGGIQTALFQPRDRGALFLAQRRMLQRFQR